MQSLRAGAPLVERVRAETDRDQRHAREQRSDDSPLTPPPAQRLGQPLGLVHHDHDAASLPV